MSPIDRLDHLTLWPIGNFYEEAGRLFFGADWDGTEGDEHEEGSISPQKINSARRARRLSYEIAEAVDQGVLKLVVDLQGVSILDEINEELKPAKYDLSTEVGRERLALAQMGIIAHFLRDKDCGIS